MQKNIIIIIICFLCSVGTVVYFMNKWHSQEDILIDNLKYLLDKNFEDKSTELKEKLSKHVASILKTEYLKSVKKRMDKSFLPDQRQDNHLKLHFRYAIQDYIKRNITETVKNMLRTDMKGIANSIVNIPPKIDSYPQNLCSKDKKLPPHQKLLVYAVFGKRKLYYESIPFMLREAVASSLYYDWHIRIYHDSLITPEIIASYKDFKNLEFCDARNIPRYGNLTNILGKFWRNIPLADETVDLMCSRDLDSALLTREEDAVREFLKSDKMLHTMRDYIKHEVGMLAGMWCMKPYSNRKMSRNFFETLLEKAKTYKLKTDQPLLNEVIWDNIKDKKKYALQHDSFHCKSYEGSIPFPTKRRDNMEFVGCPGHECNWKEMIKCPKECRPKDHQDWEYC